MTRAELIESMTKEAATMQAFMESGPTDEPSILAERLAMANVYIARSGKLLADAKCLQNEDIAAIYDAWGDKLLKLGAQMAKNVAMGKCSKSTFLVDWLDRINRGLVHSADNLRTLISFAKENMRMNRYADNVANDIYEQASEGEGW